MTVAIRDWHVPQITFPPHSKYVSTIRARHSAHGVVPTGVTACTTSNRGTSPGVVAPARDTFVGNRESGVGSRSHHGDRPGEATLESPTDLTSQAAPGHARYPLQGSTTTPYGRASVLPRSARDDLFEREEVESRGAVP